MTAKAFESQNIAASPDDQHLPVPHAGADVQKSGLRKSAHPLAMNDRAGRLDALFANQGPPDLSSDDDTAVSTAASLVASGASQRQLLTFSLDSEEYALDIESIREIIKPREITEIPRAPQHVLGILSLRGQVIPVYDLKQQLKLGSGVVTPSSRIIVCQDGDRVAGLLVDSITQVVKITKDGVETTPANMAGIDRNLLLGVGRCQGRFLILLNLPNVIDAGMN